VPAPQGGHAAHHAGAAAEGHNRERFARAVLEQRAHLLVAGRRHDRVGSPLGLARAQAHEVGVAAPGGAGDPLVVVCPHVARTDDARQAVQRRGGQGARGQVHAIQSNGRARPSEAAQGVGQEAQRAVGKRARVSGVPPPPPAHASCALAAAGTMAAQLSH